MSEGTRNEPAHWVLEWAHAGVKYAADYSSTGASVWAVDKRFRAAGANDLPPNLAQQLRAAPSGAAAAALVELVLAPGSAAARRHQLVRRFHLVSERLLQDARELVAAPPEVFDEACQAIERLEAMERLAALSR